MSQILAEDVSFHMKYCLLSWDENWGIQRPLSLSDVLCAWILYNDFDEGSTIQSAGELQKFAKQKKVVTLLLQKYA